MSRRSRVEANLSKEQIEFLDSEFDIIETESQDIREMVRQATDSYRGLAAMVLHLPPGRHQSLALTKLQESLHWANQCIMSNQAAIIQNLEAQRGEQ